MDMFTGFDKPTENYCKVPNLFFELMAHGMKECELKVTLYILRHTWGYQEFEDGRRITLDEFINGRKTRKGDRIDSGCGLKSKTSVLEGLEKAIERGTITIESDDSDMARKERYYTIKMKSDVQNLNIENGESDVQNLNISGTKFEHRTEKDNSKRKKKDSASANAHGDTSDIDTVKAQKKAEKERQDQLFEIIALGSFGKPYAALNGQRGRAGEIRKLLLEENPDITPEYLKAGYARYFEANPTIKHDPSKRMKKASVIIDWCEQAADCITPVLLEPDKDCPKCRGLGYWIDKSNPNNHQSIDCECRSKQRVKS